MTSSTSDVDKNASVGFYRGDQDGNVRNASTPSANYLTSLLSPALDDISSLGRYYSNQVQSEDYFIPASLLPTKNFILFTLGEGDLLAEDSYLEYKNYLNTFNINDYAAKPAISSNPYTYSTPHILNNFRSSYEDFT
jgi:hypothetical protein